MILYHGSNIDIEIIDLAKSKPNKDFGKGFYLSENETQAQEMAVFKSMQLGGTPVVSKFEFDRNAMAGSDLKIKVFNDYSEEWADFVLANRDGCPVERYDIVYGPSPMIRLGCKFVSLKMAASISQNF